MWSITALCAIIRWLGRGVFARTTNMRIFPRSFSLFTSLLLFLLSWELPLRSSPMGGSPFQSSTRWAASHRILISVRIPSEFSFVYVENGENRVSFRRFLRSIIDYYAFSSSWYRWGSSTLSLWLLSSYLSICCLVTSTLLSSASSNWRRPSSSDKWWMSEDLVMDWEEVEEVIITSSRLVLMSS